MATTDLKPLPTPLYGCKHCREDVSLEADELYWSELEQGWVCADCWSLRYPPEKNEVFGVSLAQELARRAAPAAPWVPCAERLPTAEDAAGNPDEYVMWWHRGLKRALMGHWASVSRHAGAYTQWTPLPPAPAAQGGGA